MEEKKDKCPYCGKDLDEGALKCPSCGAWLLDVPPTSAFSPQHQEMPAQNQATDTLSYAGGMQQQTSLQGPPSPSADYPGTGGNGRGGNNRILYIFLFVLCMFLCLCLGYGITRCSGMLDEDYDLGNTGASLGDSSLMMDSASSDSAVVADSAEIAWTDSATDRAADSAAWDPANYDAEVPRADTITTSADYSSQGDYFYCGDSGDDDWEGHHVISGKMAGGNMSLTLDVDGNGNARGTYRNLDCGTTMKVKGTMSGSTLRVEATLLGDKYDFDLDNTADGSSFSGTCYIYLKNGGMKTKPVYLTLQ